MTKASRLVFTKREMIYVTLAPQPLKLESQFKACPLALEAMHGFVQRLTMRDCRILDMIVMGECRRRGFGRPRVGSRAYVAVEEMVASDVVALELDLSEIGARIEEARWEMGGEE